MYARSLPVTGVLSVAGAGQSSFERASAACRASPRPVPSSTTKGVIRHASPARGSQLRANKAADVGERVEVLHVSLVRPQRHGVVVLEERHQLQGGERVEDAARDEGRRLGELVCVLPRQELAQNE